MAAKCGIRRRVATARDALPSRQEFHAFAASPGSAGGRRAHHAPDYAVGDTRGHHRCRALIQIKDRHPRMPEILPVQSQPPPPMRRPPMRRRCAGGDVLMARPLTETHRRRSRGRSRPAQSPRATVFHSQAVRRRDKPGRAASVPQFAVRHRRPLQAIVKPLLEHSGRNLQTCQRHKGPDFPPIR